LHLCKLDQIHTISRLLLSEASSEKHLMLKNFIEFERKELNHLTEKLQRLSSSPIHSESVRNCLLLNDPPTLKYSKRICIDDRKNFSDLIASPDMASLRPYTRRALLENSNFINHLTPAWNMILRIYEHPLNGLVMLRLSLPVEYTDHLSGKLTRSHLIAFSPDFIGRPFSASSWSNAFQMFFECEVNTFEQFNHHCLLNFSKPSCLTHNQCTNPTLETLLDKLDDLQNLASEIELQKIQTLRNFNLQVRNALGINTPVATDCCNTSQHKPLSETKQFTRNLSNWPQISSHQNPLLQMPQTESLENLMTKWNLSHGMMNSNLDKFWNQNLTADLCLCANQILRTTPRKLFLPSSMCHFLHCIFGIECQLMSDPLHSFFVNFTTLSPELHFKFNGMKEPPPHAKTFYLEHLSDPLNSYNELHSLLNHLGKFTVEKNIILALAQPHEWQATEEFQRMKKAKNLHRIASLPKNSFRPMIIDDEGNLMKHPQTFPHEITFRFLHSPSSALARNVNREKYFANLKAMKHEFGKLSIHPILNFGRQRITQPQMNSEPPPMHKEHKSALNEIRNLTSIKEKALKENPMNWTSYHEANGKILNLLPKLRIMHQSINNLLNTCELKENALNNAYFESNAWIYAIMNPFHNQTQVYIGQTGMNKSKRMRKKLWKDLERAPLQRMQEHVLNAMNTESKPKRKTGRGGVHSKRTPGYLTPGRTGPNLCLYSPSRVSRLGIPWPRAPMGQSFTGRLHPYLGCEQSIFACTSQLTGAIYHDPTTTC